MTSKRVPEGLTIFKILGVGEGSTGDDGKLDLLKWLALDARPLGQTFLGLLENLTLRNRQLSRRQAPKTSPK